MSRLLVLLVLSYVVPGSTGSGEDWTDDSGTIEATSSTAGICLQLMTAHRFYRLTERVAINP